MKKNIKLFLSLFTFLILLQGCSSSIYQNQINTDDNDKYDTEFPYKDSSPILEKVSDTIHRISSIAFYEAYSYDQNSNVKLYTITDENLETKAFEKIFFNKTGLGTATVIYSENRKLALLTCSHIVDYPDTIVTYWTDKKGNETEFIKTISFKKNENIYAVGLPELGRLNILASDREMDLAILGITFSVDYPGKFPSLSIPIGHSNQLSWGAFVYMFGYPINYKMISHAIVSVPQKRNIEEFLIDGVVNRGFSGGLVMAVRNGIPNLELVGIIRSVPKDVQYILQPEKLKDNNQYDPLVAYNGKIYLETDEKINYGISKVISTETIDLFLKKYQNKFSEEGYLPIRFFKTK
ncbi:MAG: hypothetical protein CO128_06525 [Ignavibacteriales bacterium CG_4_9_14_3_um_filter_30_11]|nr:MAG: hypothetical protein CO128_06525 [Ignavibacteriales bacterium CG_4_9_14_3_um_filter_30_11]